MIAASTLPGRPGWKTLLLALALALGAPAAGGAAELGVRVSGLAEPPGQVGGLLLTGASGFPMDNAKTRVQWQAACAKGVVCRYADLGAPRFDVAAFKVPADAREVVIGIQVAK